MKQSDFADLVELAGQRGFSSLYSYAETARKDYKIQLGLDLPDPFDESKVDRKWLAYWYPDQYKEMVRAEKKLSYKNKKKENK